MPINAFESISPVCFMLHLRPAKTIAMEMNHSKESEKIENDKYWRVLFGIRPMNDPDASRTFTQASDPNRQWGRRSVALIYVIFLLVAATMAEHAAVECKFYAKHIRPFAHSAALYEKRNTDRRWMVTCGQQANCVCVSRTKRRTRFD